MHKIIKTATITLLAGMLIISLAGCTSSTGTAKKAITVQRQVAVQKGSMYTTVSVDGNLVMPEASSLAFGSSGNVKEVLVHEGDRVKAGAIMATLEDTTQVLDIKSSNISVQNVLANLYEKVPRLPQFPGNYYVDYPTSDPSFTPGIIIYDRNNPPNPIMASELGITITPRIYRLLSECHVIKLIQLGSERGRECLLVFSFRELYSNVI